MKPTQKPRGFYIPIIRISLFSGADEFITWEGPSGLGFHLPISQKQLRKDLPTEKWWPGKKVPRNPPSSKLLVIFCVHRNPSNRQSPNKKTQIQGSEEKLSFEKHLLFYRNWQTRANLVHQKMWDRLKQNSLGSTALGICLEPAPTSQNPLEEPDFISPQIFP